MKRLLSGFLVAALVMPASVQAQSSGPIRGSDAEYPPPPPPPPPEPPPASACNPPCEANEQCMPNGNCRGRARTSDAPVAQPIDDVRPSGDGAPAGFHYETSRRKGLLIGGVIILSVSYLISAVLGLAVAIVGEGGAGAAYFVPVIGPWIGQAALGGFQTNGTTWAVATALALAQGAGLTMLIFGVRGSRELVRDDGREDASARPSTTGPRWSLAPGAPGAPLGLSLLVQH